MNKFKIQNKPGNYTSVRKAKAEDWKLEANLGYKRALLSKVKTKKQQIFPNI